MAAASSSATKSVTYWPVSHGVRQPPAHTWTRDDLERIHEHLATPLALKETAKRVGPGGKRIAYVEGWMVLDKANEIFGATGWSCEIKSIKCNCRRDSTKGGYYAKTMVVCRVTLQDGTAHEDVSVAGRYARTEHEAEMMACKTAVTDARKRVLRCFGRHLGNSVYDKAGMKRQASAPAAMPAPKFNRGVSKQEDEDSDDAALQSVDLEAAQAKHQQNKRQRGNKD